ncbi:hypothetical protein ACP4J4_02640 [Aureimonas ureilytica]|uniref:hypothetical protein n=1 Tax=Aureimonas ureilytica TaxID=401562 RepID=UPI003CEEF738
MTAINVFVRPDRAFLMTDGAFYLPDGHIVGFGNKAMPIPNLNAAIAVRGLQKVVAEFAFDFSIRYRNFDDLAARLQDDLSEWQDLRARDAGYTAWSDVDLYVVGWSDDEQRMKALNFMTRAGGTDYAVGEVEEIGEFTVGPYPSDEEWFVNLRSLGASLEGDDAVRRFDPIRHGIPIMEAQRRMMVDPAEMGSAFTGTTPISLVGGHITLTEVSKDGVSQRVVYRWADEPGVPIKPAAFVAPSRIRPTPPSNLSRQQRRAWERQHGRLAA